MNIIKQTARSILKLFNLIGVKISFIKNRGKLEEFNINFYRLNINYKNELNDLSEIKKIQKVKNKTLKEKKLKDLIKKYPKSHLLEYELSEVLFDKGSSDFKVHLENYLKKFKSWSKENNFNDLNFEFVDPGVIIGSFGRFSHLGNLLEANNLNLRKNKN